MCFKTLTHGGHIYPTTLGTLAYPSLQEMTLGEVVGGPQSCPTFDLFMEIQIGNVTKLGHSKKKFIVFGHRPHLNNPLLLAFLIEFKGRYT